MNKSSNNVATGGVTTALIILFLYAGVIIKSNKLFFMFISTIIAVIPYVKCNVRTGLLTYFATIILSVFLLPNKFYAVSFAFLGIYPFVKLVSEKKTYIKSFILKYLWFNSTILILYYLFQEFIYFKGFFSSICGKIVLLICLEILFFTYDYLYTKFIDYIKYRLLKI